MSIIRSDHRSQIWLLSSSDAPPLTPLTLMLPGKPLSLRYAASNIDASSQQASGKFEQPNVVRKLMRGVRSNAALNSLASR